MNIRLFLTSLGQYIKKVDLFIFRHNIKKGKKVKIDFTTKINNNSNEIILGNYVYLRSNNINYHAGMPFNCTLFIDVKGASIKIGNYSRINGAFIHAQKSITIGENCVIASGVNIIDSNGHELYSSNRTINRDVPDSIVIGNNVWIGINAVILKGANIGDNSVVSAASVVKGSFPPNSLIMGNPAVLVKKIEC